MMKLNRQKSIQSQRSPAQHDECVPIDPEEGVPIKYTMVPVFNRRGYIMQKIHLCLIAGMLLVTGGACVRTVTPPERPSGMSAFDGVRLRTEWTDSGTVVLTKGRYVEPAEPGSTSQVVIQLSDKGAKGLVDGREIAAAVLISSGGGSGTFYDLVLLIWGPDGWKHMDTSPLGDRVKVHSISLAGREIIVDLTQQGPDDPMCCPTLRRTKRYLVEDGRLKVH
jgi:hypothetical protein